jgi:hypothetical protein
MGLLKQVTHLFRNPARDMPAQSSKRSSLALEQQVVSTDDFMHDAKRTWQIRRREFGKLRKLRRHEAHPDAVQRPFFFSVSTFLKDEERESTLKKIDEIEALMSMQWWKTDRLDKTQNT